MTADIKSDVVLPPEISKYKAILSKDPGSMVFAPLAEAYRKLGMLDEAIATAQDGVKRRPDYVSGMVALGRACYEKGLLADARKNLERVLVIAPDNIIAAGILDEIITKQEVDGLQSEIIDEVQDDKQEQKEAEAMVGVSQSVPDSDYEVMEEVETDVINEVELEELTDIVELDAEQIPEDFQINEIRFEAPGPGLGFAKEEIEIEGEKVPEDNVVWEDENAGEVEDHAVYEEVVPESNLIRAEAKEKEARPKKEITTETIADLYIKQGYLDKAIDIYQTLFDAHPGNDDIKNKLEELKEKVVVKVEAKEERPIEMDANISGVARLESWLEVIQRKRRKG